jgi:uncharacterized protein (UPF0332 family)
VNDASEPYLSKAQESLAGAQSELVNGRYNNAANRAYYAAYNAAVIALLKAGISRPLWTHEEVQALFAGQLINRRKLYPTSLRSVLSELSAIRNRADYGQRTVSRSDAENMVREAQNFLIQVIGAT